MGWKRDIEDLVMFGLALAVVFAMFLGCGIQLDPARLVAAPPGSSEAISVVLGSYHANGNGMPPIAWYSPEPDGPCSGALAAPSDGTCVAGWEIDGSWGRSGHIVVMVYPDLHQSWIILAHEIAHWRYDVDGHPAAVFGDFDHTGVDGGSAGIADAALATWEASALAESGK